MSQTKRDDKKAEDFSNKQRLIRRQITIWNRRQGYLN